MTAQTVQDFPNLATIFLEAFSASQAIPEAQLETQSKRETYAREDPHQCLGM